MIPPFDIFQTATDGAIRWLEAAATLQDATARVQALKGPNGVSILSSTKKRDANSLSSSMAWAPYPS